ncbi:helicase PriA essential for OriC/DnaA-independent DNA replication [Gracilibacillus boraciitolerans JCM 21714]|uniref:Replication restart protein PriA n=1 Tax=Gracilibacillus boraciitolerans JCM 21714 TaxID=1298598 RepID=W4VET7_9BACI|nr:primosomal protein N' [Gracilibacillus boraciitolerans]GAE91686.1 helicase PriA essential for OriC/DnaA-independent DNA replication [Gracilibacillus boraciitolerans JCM 21714]
MQVAKVIVDVPTSQTNHTFDYLIPEPLENIVIKGMRVSVPFGPRKVMGFVVEVSDHSEFDKLKPLDEVMDLTPVLTDELLQLGKWMSEQTVSFYIQNFQAMLPQILKAKYKKEIEALTDVELPEGLQQLFAGRTIMDFEEFIERNGNYALLLEEIKNGHVQINYIVKSKETKKTKVFIGPNKEQYLLEEAIEDMSNRAKKQKKIMEWFIQQPEPVEQQLLLTKLQTTSSTINQLVDKKLLKKIDKKVYRDPFQNTEFERTTSLPLNSQQQAAIKPIWDAIDSKKDEVFLLHGVTGSGKTEVYLQAIERVLVKGEEAIVLVPEIALTPQMVQRFKGRFGSEVAVLHSALSPGEKFDEWTKIHKKEVKVVVGARSAIFAPFENIGIIIIDEEHETSYKQDEQPRYHAREVAKKRGSYHNCPIVLGSATPMLESYARAKKGVYRLLEMPDRMNEGEMPPVEIIDMRDELYAGNRTMFSRNLLDAIKSRIERKEQVVLFLNRRGHSTFVMCRECGDVMKCPACDIALTYHKSSHQLKCHYCDYQIPMVKECQVCKSKTIRYFGTGTQKVEEALREHIPEAKVIRMDVDTTRRKGSHKSLLDKFGNGEANILLGTQMIAKGLDFERVTLVGVLAVDTMLHLPDFRSSEKTFQLLTQVSGRAGRHKLPGEVIIQTYTPEHYSIQLASQYQYQQFFQQEMETRKGFHYPPYYFLTLINVSHPNQLKAQEVTKTICKLLFKHLSAQATVLGPTPSPIVRINNRYRYQCMVKYKDEPNQREVMRRILKHYHDDIYRHDLTIQVDFEPYSLM